jgi:fibronectin-binding autotransporter adhesin
MTFRGNANTTTLSGSLTFNVANSAGGGAGTLNLEPLNDGGNPVAITLGGAGAVTLNSPATSLVRGTVININNGTLNSNNPTAIGSLATVNLGFSGNFAVGASQTISALNSTSSGAGQVSLGTGTVLTLGSTDNLSSNFSGSINGSGSLIKAGSGAATISGPNGYTGGTTVSSGTLVAGTTASLGASAVTLNGGTLRLVPVNGQVSYGFSSFAAPNGAASIASNVLTLTTNVNNEANSVFTSSALPFQTGSSGFTAAYIYQVQGTQNAIADGSTFVLQENGTTVVGGNGGNLGYKNGSITNPSVAVETDVFNGNLPNGAQNPNGGAAIETNGVIPNQGGAPNTWSLVPFLASGDQVQVNISYSPTGSGTLSETFTDLTNAQAPVTITSTVNLASVLGTGTAYIGFTGGTGGEGSLQTISNFSYSIGIPGGNSTYANGLILNGGTTSAIDIAATASAPTITAGTLQIGSGANTTLNLTATTAPKGQAYGLTLGAVSLGGSVNINVADNTVGGGNALGTLTLGSLNDNLAPATSGGYTINLGGAGAVTLAAAASSLVPGTIVNLNSGTLNLNAAGALGTTATVNVGSLANLSLGANQTVSALNGAGSVTLATNTLTIGSTDNLSSNFSGSISDFFRGGSLRVNTTGSVTFSAANNYIGATTISAGSLVLTSTASLGNTAISVGSAGTLSAEPAASGIIRVGSSGGGSAGATLNLGSGTFDMTGVSTLGTFAVQQQSGFSGPALSMSGATLKFNLGSAGSDELVVNGPGTAVVSGVNTISIAAVGSLLTSGQQDTLISSPAGGLGGTFEFPNSSTLETITLGSSRYTLSLSNSATAETLIIGQSITSTWQPTTAGSYNWSSPTSNWTAGNVPQSSGDNAIFGQPTSSGPQTITIDQPAISVGTLTFNNTGSSVYTIGPSGSNTLVLNNGGAGATAIVLNSTNNNAISAPVTFISKVTADVNAGTSLTLSGVLTGSTALNLNPDSGNTGTLIVSANNSGSFSSSVNLHAGTLNFANGSLGTGNITFAGSSTLQYATGNSQDVSTYIQAIPSGVVATIDTNGNSNVSFNTGLTGLGGLTKIGAGTLTLSGTNSYSGPTSISGGALQVNGSLTATSGVSVGANGTLGGSGTITSSVSTVAGGQISPSLGLGSPPTTLSITGNLTLAGGSVLNYYLSNAGFAQSDDLVTVSGNLALQGGGTLNVTGNPVPGTYELVGFNSSTGNVGGWSVVGNPSDIFVLTNNQLDLLVGSNSGSGSWISNSSNNYGLGGNWSGGGVPSQAGEFATFGSGTETSVSIASPYTIGVLNFTSTARSYILSGSGSLTLNNNGASGGAQVNVSANVFATLETSLILADSTNTTTFNIGSNGYLFVSGSSLANTAISGSGQSLVLTGSGGGGTLELASPNTYTGSTTVSAGTLQIDGGASIASTSISIAAGGTLLLAGPTAALPSAANITTHGTGSAGDGAFNLTGITTQTVGIISGDTQQISDVNSQQVTVYSGNTTVGDGSNAASLTAKQILQNTLTIAAGSTVTIAPSGPGMPTAGSASSATAAETATAATTSASDSSDPSGADALAAIQDAISSGAISSGRGEQLEKRIAAIEQLATSEPGLDVSLLEGGVLASLPSSSVWSAGGSPPLGETGSGLLAVDSSTFGSGSGSALGGAAAFDSGASFGGSPAAVPEPSTLLLAALGGIGLLIAARRRTI